MRRIIHAILYFKMEFAILIFFSEFKNCREITFVSIIQVIIIINYSNFFVRNRLILSVYMLRLRLIFTIHTFKEKTTNKIDGVVMGKDF